MLSVQPLPLRCHSATDRFRLDSGVCPDSARRCELSAARTSSPVRGRASTLTLLVAELHSRTGNPDFDMTRIALQTWAEAPRDPVLDKRGRVLYLDTLDHIAELADRWRDDGHISPDSDTKAVAASIFSLMHGLIVMHHLVDDVRADALRNGVSLLGAAAASFNTLTATPPQEARP
jgi:hypothetical protein